MKTTCQGSAGKPSATTGGSVHRGERVDAFVELAEAIKCEKKLVEAEIANPTRATLHHG